MTRFETAAEVKAYVKAAGFAERVKVSGRTSPWNGSRFFSVSLPERSAVGGVVSSFGSREPLTFAAFPDAGEATQEKVRVLTELQAILASTNADAASV